MMKEIKDVLKVSSFNIIFLGGLWLQTEAALSTLRPSFREQGW